MPPSQALGERPPSKGTVNQLVRDYLETAGKRLDELEEKPHMDEDLVWAIRDVRWAVHHLLEIVEAYRDAS